MRVLSVISPVVAGTALAALRWGWQGSGNLYSDLSHRSYVPDTVAGWRLTDDGPIWLGLDIVGVLAALTLGILVAAWWLDKRDASSGLKALLWAASAAALIPSTAAFFSGGLPEGAVETRPTVVVQAPDGGVTVSLRGLSAGRYIVRGEHPVTSVLATVSAGGESFETRFAGASGELLGDPSDLSQPLAIAVEVDASTVDTGVELRSKSARDYLQVQQHPTMTLSIDALSATTRFADDAVTFAAEGRLGFVGDTIVVTVTGTLTALDQGSRRQRGIDASEAILVSAAFAIPIAETALKADASDFSSDEIPIHVTLLLTKS